MFAVIHQLLKTFVRGDVPLLFNMKRLPIQYLAFKNILWIKALCSSFKAIFVKIRKGKR